ncbi:MAG: aminomethyl-transferring glycine dehydrogenase [Planctomycetes bacterium]|nr:aminomethyl-transferring glycine dehydrogenase [Planctomycetota bacterium]
MSNPSLRSTDTFADRHIGPRPHEIDAMLATLGVRSLDELVARAVPSEIRMDGDLELDEPRSEAEVLGRLRALAGRNRVFRSYLGLGYHDCHVPPVIQRSILENPGWYTQYTPYQAEISQGRLEALLVFQTVVIELTGLEIANASLLDEATAAAEAMTLAQRVRPKGSRAEAIFVSAQCHPQTIEVVRTRAAPLGIEVVVGEPESFGFEPAVFGAIGPYPATDGRVHDWRAFVERAHAHGALVIAVADLMSLVLLTPPGEWGADVCVGNSQRFGVPLGFGGPHAAFLAGREEHVRKMAGRIVGVARDAHDRPAYRLALATREQHIRREKATSNICTAQVLLAILAAMYAVYHGPEGLRRIARRIHRAARTLDAGLRRLGYDTGDHVYFDTLHVRTGARRDEILQRALAAGINLRALGADAVGVALDETVTEQDLDDLLGVFACGAPLDTTAGALADGVVDDAIPAPFARRSPPLRHPIFEQYHSEHDLVRYLHRLETRDLSLTTSMIPLGSCTMKLNAAAELLPITWPEFGRIHPFAPAAQAEGYHQLFGELEAMLQAITGFAAISLQPNAGAQGEYTGLLVIRAYHQARGEPERNVCLIPESAHGTNPASAALAGMEIVGVRCDDRGNVDVADLRAQAERHRAHLAALMITYPSTHGVFEASIKEVCRIIHEAGGQVYMDGANMNAQVGICRPAELGADVCHLNLHKTFAIPHGGGGPGVGPIGVAAHLAPFLPGHPLVACGGKKAIGPVSAAPWGSASILPISYAYIALMGAAGLKRATQMAILNANYMARRLEPYYPVLYKGPGGFVAHEFILDTRPLKDRAAVRVDDIAKRLMDYGFHAPTISFPVPGTLMIEPTESEPKAELDRLCDALIAIRGEIAAIERGEADPENNPLRRAPHTAEEIAADAWDRPYSRALAAFPAPWTRVHKYWPPVGRIDNTYGDRNFVGRCPLPDA